MTDQTSWAAGGSIPSVSPSLEPKVQKLREVISGYPRVLVAFSGGSDSALLYKFSADTLGLSNVIGITSRSESLPQRENVEVREFVRAYNLRHYWIRTREILNPNYAENPLNRCYYCKSELYTSLGELASHWNIRILLNGTNTDDLGDWRPGLEAAREYQVQSPLAQAGFSKADVREVSKALGLPTWDKPAAPCLSSRFAYGESITVEELARIDEAENAMKDLGFRIVRVRSLKDRIRVEVGADEVKRFFQEPQLQEKALKALESLGLKKIEISKTGYESGRLNKEAGIKL